MRALRFWILAFAAGLFWPTPSVLGQVTVEDIMAEPAFFGAELSPGGRYLAGVVVVDDNRWATVVDLQAPEDDVPTYMPIPDAFINWIEWASDDRMILSVTVYVNRRGRVIPISDLLNDPDVFGRSVRRLMAINRDGSDPVVLLDGSRGLRRNFNRARVVDFLEDDPDHILMPAILRGDLDLFKVNLIDGSHERLASGASGTIGWYTDDDGEPAFRLDVNRRFTKLTFLAREDRENGKIKWKKVRTIRLNTRRDDDEEQTEFRPIRPGPDLDTYYVVARPEGADTSGIYLYNFEQDEFVETLATHPELDISNGIFYSETDKFAGYSFYEDRLTYRMQDKTLQAHLDGLNAYFGDELNISLVDQSDDDKSWLIYASGPTDAGSWHLYDVEAVEMRELGSRMRNLPFTELAPMQVIDYVARDGLNLTGYLTRPKHAPADAKLPLIMLPHGGPELRDYFVYRSEVQMLAALGYQVFQPNFRGSDGYGHSFAQKGRRELGRAMQDDVDDGYDHLVSLGLVERGNACIVGTSYGGYSALMGAVRNDGEYRCAVSTAGPTHWTRMMRWLRDTDGQDSDTYDYWMEQLGDPKRDRDRELMEEVSPEKRAKDINIPVLLIHGEYDNIVPIEQSRRMARALRRADKSVEYVKLPDSGHSFRSRDDEKTEREALISFLQAHLPVGNPDYIAAQ